jgi:hypothetical protein
MVLDLVFPIGRSKGQTIYIFESWIGSIFSQVLLETRPFCKMIFLLISCSPSALLLYGYISTLEYRHCCLSPKGVTKDMQ